MKESDTTASVPKLNDSEIPINTSSQNFNPKSFLFNFKSPTSTSSNTTPSGIFSSPKPTSDSSSIDSTKTDDIKSTSFNICSTTTPNSGTYGLFSSPKPFSTTGTTETQNAALNSLFLKTDDNKSKTNSLFNFSPKTDSPFKFGVVSKDPKSIFGQNLLSNKDNSVDTSISKGIYILYKQ